MVLVGARQSPSRPVILSGLDDEATFQCCVRAQSVRDSFSQVNFTTDTIVSDTARVQGGLPIWILCEASRSVGNRKARTKQQWGWLSLGQIGAKPVGGYSKRTWRAIYLARPVGG